MSEENKFANAAKIVSMRAVTRDNFKNGEPVIIKI